jgi:S1 RNA binding domain protein
MSSCTNFGAFVQLESGETGLVHISEVADAYVKDIHDYLQVNDTVKVKIINIDGRKIGLSIRQTRPKPQVSFEERMNRFLKDSEERQTDLRKNVDSKRGGRGSAGFEPRPRGRERVSRD